MKPVRPFERFPNLVSMFFARAAERMGLAKSILSRRVSRLESRLSAKLLTRTARGVQPTHVGEAYATRAANSLAELEAAAAGEIK